MVIETIVSWWRFRHRPRCLAMGDALETLAVVELLGFLVESNALCSTVQEAESSDPELFAGLHKSLHPSACAFSLKGLSLLEHLLGHDLTVLVQHQVILC